MPKRADLVVLSVAGASLVEGKWIEPWTWRMHSAWRTSSTDSKLGWSDARRASEVAAVRERLVEDLAFKDHSKGAADPASGGEEWA
jgi:hypothetical protein